MATGTTASSDIRQGIDQANQGFEEAFNRGDPAAAARGVYTRDARILPPGAEMIQGRESIEQFWKAAAEQLGIRSVKLETVELQPMGDGALEIGRAMLGLEGGQQLAVKYVVVWKQEDGGWKWHVDIWNTNA
jgi:ketosteroid isomerase-like protein